MQAGGSPTKRLRPVGPGHPANNIRGDQRTVHWIPHEHGFGSGQCDKSRGRGWAGTHHVLLAVLGYDHNLEHSILTVAARHPVGVHDRDTSRLFTCSWHGANLRGSRFPGEPWNVVTAPRADASHLMPSPETFNHELAKWSGAGNLTSIASQQAGCGRYHACLSGFSTIWTEIAQFRKHG